MHSIVLLFGFWSITGAILGLLAVPYAAVQTLETLSAVPDGWTQISAPSPWKPLRFRIAVKQPNAASFEQTVLDISTPNHPKYGQHLKRNELKAMLRPTDEATEGILSWLAAEGVPRSRIEDDGDWINFLATTRHAERILDTKFYYYRNEINKVERIRTLHYSVPLHLHRHINMIQPTTRFGQVRAARSTVLDSARMEDTNDYYGNSGLNVTFCNNTITPTCIKELYNIKNFTADPNNGNKLGICGYLKEYAKYDDLHNFLEEFAPNEVSDNFTFVSVNGGLLTQNDTVDDDVEANLDVQYGLSISYPTPSLYYSTGGLGELVPDLDQPNITDDQNEPYLDFLNYILKLPDSELPQTLTTSYGEDEQSVPEAYTNATCNMFAQLGARGVSVLFSSGDTGVGSACQTNDGKNTTRFLPIFPAACPFVTSVGGVHNVEPEQAIFFSSGGFSDRFARPAYQDQAVIEFLDILGDQWEGLYNPNGRGFPDVAAQSYNFSVYDSNEGGVIPVGGTSAAAPTFAAIVSLLNSARLSANLPPLGFLNPWIYSVGRYGLNDIVNGGSRGCTGTDIYSGLPAPFVPFASWNATKGWDPVTGYGTPNFGKLLRLSTPSAHN
ncbi:MAG: vesicle formation at the endoplasmic reticulum [Pycnora praestabilis]|nr:MAG: vesicle formation at the endoplasmic reticulum [Pycnora praestabilis]